MKKRMKLLSVLLLVVLMSGCVKYNISMEVGSDKSVSISVISAVASSGDEEAETDEEEESALTKKGFKAEAYKTDSWVGTKYTKKYDNIDDISSDSTGKVELADLMDEEKEEPKTYFKKEGSIFKTTYVANFTIDLTDGEDGSSSGMTAETMDTYGAEFTYDVKLPVKVDDSNATTVSEDGKTLTWKLRYGEVNTVTYEFSMTNTTMYIVVAAVAAVLVIGVIVVLVNKKKKTPTQQMPMNGGMPVPNMDTNNANNPVAMNNNFAANPVPGMMQPESQPSFVNPTDTPNLMETNPLEQAVEPVQPTEPTNLPSLENQPPLVDVAETPVIDAAPVIEDVTLTPASDVQTEATVETPAEMPMLEPAAPVETPVVENTEVTPPVVEENKDSNI